MHLQKNLESPKEHSNDSKSQQLKFVMTSVSSCQHKFSNIGSTMYLVSTAVKCQKQTQVMSTS
jgi:hypothetical protein